MTADLRLLYGPTTISLLITLLRLAGELFHWSDRWFSTATGGIQPSGWTWLIGITWLPVVFGPYFARALGRRLPPPPATRVLLFSVLGVVLVFLGFGLLLPRVSLAFPESLLVAWAIMVAAASIQLLAWPGLCRLLLLYGVGSRAPVAVIMWFAMHGRWGTHYDYVDMPAALQLAPLPRFLWLAFFPQLVFWTAFTVILGSLAAGVYLILAPRAGAGSRS
jgi:hypothetical protein